jgi:hypothetical protein
MTSTPWSPGTRHAADPAAVDEPPGCCSPAPKRSRLADNRPAAELADRTDVLASLLELPPLPMRARNTELASARPPPLRRRPLPAVGRSASKSRARVSCHPTAAAPGATWHLRCWIWRIASACLREDRRGVRLRRALYGSLLPQVGAYGSDAVRTRSGRIGNVSSPKAVATAR